jgi:hypothetical protein
MRPPLVSPTVASMDPEAARSVCEASTALTPQLPVTHADALALDGAGYSADVIAARVGVPVEAVPTLLEIARAKVRGLVSSQPCEGRQNQ